MQITAKRTEEQVGIFNEVLHTGPSHFKGECSTEKAPDEYMSLIKEIEWHIYFSYEHPRFEQIKR